MSYDDLFKPCSTDANAFIATWKEKREGGGLNHKGWRFLLTNEDKTPVLSYREIEGEAQEAGVPEQIAEKLGFPDEGRQGYYWFMKPN